MSKICLKNYRSVRLKLVSTYLSFKNDPTGTAIETGNVRTIFNNLFLSGKVVKSHGRNASRRLFRTTVADSAVEFVEPTEDV